MRKLVLLAAGVVLIWGLAGYLLVLSVFRAPFPGGASLGGGDKYVHTPDFDIDEDALPVGAAMLAETALRLLRGLR